MNHDIKCDVLNCKHNVNRDCCGLDSVKIGCGCENCTCCEDFEEQD